MSRDFPTSTSTVEQLVQGALRGVQGFKDEMQRQGIHVGVNGTCVTDGEQWPCRASHGHGAAAGGLEVARAHARRTDPVTSDRTVKSIAKDHTIAGMIWTYAMGCRKFDIALNDTLLTEALEAITGRRQQRNVIARARGLMEDAGLLRQVGIRYYEGRELMHYEIDPNNPKEHPK